MQIKGKVITKRDLMIAGIGFFLIIMLYCCFMLGAVVICNNSGGTLVGASAVSVQCVGGITVEEWWIDYVRDQGGLVAGEDFNISVVIP